MKVLETFLIAVYAISGGTLLVVFSASLGYSSGVKEGYKQYHKGEIVCETRLSGEIECIKRKDVK